MLPASLLGFLLGQLCSCLEIVKAVHISLLSLDLLVAITIGRFYDYPVFLSVTLVTAL
jgi:hypothetical protein